MRVGSLFSGVGGFDLAFANAGAEVVFQVEIDPKCQAVLRDHFPGVPQMVDVVKVDGEALPACDALVGGFPCQDVSVAGRGAGLAGGRSGLFFEFVRLIGELQPRFFLIENVPGLLSSNGGRDMGTVVRSLAKLGYGLAWRVLDAQYVGVPQRRRRVWIVGCAGADVRRAGEILFERESLSGAPPPRLPAREAPTGSLGSSTRNGGGMGSGGAAGESANLVVAHAVGVKSRLDFNGEDFVVTPIQDAREVEKLQNGLGIGAPGDPMYTIDGASQHAVLTQSRVRRLTPLECERLQGFPDGWTAGQADTARYKQMGNAVAVPVAQWIAERMVA